ncbi:MAG: ATP-binding protein [Streptosporangiaceae bacterium]
MATVELTFSALPAHVRTARLVAASVARNAGVAEHLLDEVRIAVGEACSRAVEAHRRHCPKEPIRIELHDNHTFEVVVVDAAPASDVAAHVDARSPETMAPPRRPDRAAEPLPPDFGLAVVAALAHDVDVSASPHGVRVRMSWPAGAARTPDEGVQ